MTRHLVSALGILLLIAACARPKDEADTTSVLAVDTVKPATTALQSPDTTIKTDTVPDTVPATKTSTGTKTKARVSDTATKQDATKELGRDSIIRVDLKNKRRQLPPADTTKRP